MMAGEYLVFCTCSSTEEATRLAGSLVREHLAACVNILPALKSVYRWEGEVQSNEESLLLIKTISERLEGVEQRLKELHSYDTPEIIAVAISGGSSEYLSWLRGSCLP